MHASCTLSCPLCVVLTADICSSVTELEVSIHYSALSLKPLAVIHGAKVMVHTNPSVPRRDHLSLSLPASCFTPQMPEDLLILISPVLTQQSE